MTATFPPFVNASFVPANPDAALCDVRWYLDGRSGREAYAAAHLPGAVFVDLERHLTRDDAPATEGRHPFPTPEAFADAMGSLGIGDDSVVVAYDDAGGFVAGRLVVMLRMLGRRAALLDGGITAWTGELERGAGTPRPPRHFTAEPWPADRLATLPEVRAALAAGTPVIDGRAAERFRGEVALIDKRPGHIPGARSAPVSDVVDEHNRLIPLDALRRHFAARGIDAQATDAIAYCGSGVSANLNILAIEHAGMRPPRLFVPSWSGYSAEVANEAELGAGTEPRDEAR